ncbi:MAG: M24 family metallopeptidase [Candidatus Thiodiazotropha sp. (ex Lucinoma borealis)]|nr:M24 family metallopeptidase [Candidatus Thiodiazotropha sp. (ex Lucinoma borealis)]MCU7869796.1 M24 family metallopeptidase [Candidatus Thiodiazotropha sp. (ex Lucinoma borealis)]
MEEPETMTDYVNNFRPSKAEIERRYNNIRTAMEEHGLDHLIVSGSEYSGFEGAVRYMCGFHILHRYAYVVIPLEGDPVCVFPREATWVGDHSATFLEQREFPSHCGDWIADYLKARHAKQVGIYGLDYIINVRDYSSLAGCDFTLVDFEIPFDYARAQKSEEELASVRHSMAINKEGVLKVIQAYAPGKTEAELMGVAEHTFATRGCGRNTMDMILTGPKGSLTPQMVFPSQRPVEESDALMYGLEISGEGGHWVEFSRVLAPNGLDKTMQEMMLAYQEFHELAEEHMKAGNNAEAIAKACMKPIFDRGYRSGHVCGHSIGMTMIEMPRIGEGFDFILPENMVCSMHPHFMTEDRTHSLYFQETYRVGKEKGEALSGVPMKWYEGGEKSF